MSDPGRKAEVTGFKERVVLDTVDWRYVLDRRQSLRKRLRQHERLRRYQAISKRLGLWFRSTSMARRLGWGIPKRKLAGKAPLVATVGADGSGKSRLTKDLERWLGWKLEVRHVYFGQPKGGVVWRLLSKPGSLHAQRWGQSGQYPQSGHTHRYLEVVVAGQTPASAGSEGAG